MKKETKTTVTTDTTAADSNLKTLELAFAKSEPEEWPKICGKEYSEKYAYMEQYSAYAMLMLMIERKDDHSRPRKVPTEKLKFWEKQYSLSERLLKKYEFMLKYEALIQSKAELLINETHEEARERNANYWDRFAAIGLTTIIIEKITKDMTKDNFDEQIKLLTAVVERLKSKTEGLREDFEANKELKKMLEQKPEEEFDELLS